MNFINRTNSSKLVLPEMVHSIFIIIIIAMKKNPRVIVHSRHQHQFSLNVWAGIIDKFFIGPFSHKGTKYVDFLSTY